MTDEFRRVTIAVAQSKSVYERVQAVQSLLADARRAALEPMRALLIALTEADGARELSGVKVYSEAPGAPCIGYVQDVARALLDDAGGDKPYIVSSALKDVPR